MELKTLVLNPTASSEVAARVKVLNPVTSSGPSMHAQIISFSDGGFQVRVPRRILVGSHVQVRTRDTVAFGEVRSMVPAGDEFDIGVQVQRSS